MEPMDGGKYSKIGLRVLLNAEEVHKLYTKNAMNPLTRTDLSAKDPPLKPDNATMNPA